MGNMAHLLILVQILLAGPGDAIRMERFNYQITPRPGWKRSDAAENIDLGKGTAQIQFLVWKTRLKDLDAIVKAWRPNMESGFKEPEARVVNWSRFGGQPARTVEIEQGMARLTWVVTRYGDYAYAFHYHRFIDSGTDHEASAIRDSFNFLKTIVEAKPSIAKAPPIPAAKHVDLAWKYECIKPAGMTNLDPKKFDASEKRNGVVARLDAIGEQSRLMIRVFASRSRMPIKLLGERRIKEFEARYKKRKTTIIDRKWKLKGARKTLHLRLVGLGTQTVAEDWYFADCRNGMMYEFQIYRSGAAKWEKQVAQFLQGFVVRSKSRLSPP